MSLKVASLHQWPPTFSELQTSFGEVRAQGAGHPLHSCACREEGCTCRCVCRGQEICLCGPLLPWLGVGDPCFTVMKLFCVGKVGIFKQLCYKEKQIGTVSLTVLLYAIDF